MSNVLTNIPITLVILWPYTVGEVALITVTTT